MILGAHESISGGYHKSFIRARKDGCNSLQVFVKSPRMWKAKPISEGDAELFKKAQEKTGINPVVAHASYIINLVNSDVKKRDFALKHFIIEIKRCEKLGIPYYIFHPGSSNSHDSAQILINQLDKAVEETSNVQLLVENMSGQGSFICSDFSEIGKVLDGVEDKERIGVCFDTCHAFSSGYDISNFYEKVFKEFDDIIGLSNLRVFHLNDSKKGLGSNIDRHECIGRGEIGDNFFKKLVNDKRFKNIPGILETPVLNEDSYRINLKRLRSFIC